jgi:CBS domain-containing protein
MATVAQLLQQKSPAVHSIAPDAPVLAAIALLAEHGIGALVVLENEQLVGIVSERDYARKVILCGRSSSDTPVSHIMSTPVLTVGPDQSMRECMELVTNYRVRHLPVVEGGKVIGILSIGDLLRAALAEQQQTIEQLERYIHS